MLDLNIDIVSSECKVLIHGDKLTLALMEDSSSTNSSIINADDVPSNVGVNDENSSNEASAFVFDIIRKETTDDDTTMITNVKIVENLSRPDYVTQLLLPVTACENGGEAKSSAAARPRWLNLSYTAKSSAGGAVEVKAQPRKSRRGPRCRSSQFRGVTFYR